MSLEVVVYQENGTSNTFEGSKTKYEETYDGTSNFLSQSFFFRIFIHQFFGLGKILGSGWFNFRKDIKANLNLKKDDFQLELQKDENTWVPLTNGEQLQEAIDKAGSSGKIVVRLAGGKQTSPKNLESGTQQQQQQQQLQNTASSGGGCGCCCRAIGLVLVYSILFPLWVICFLGCLILDLIFLPFECCCPCVAPCLCVAECIGKGAWKFVFWIVKLPFEFAKKMLQ